MKRAPDLPKEARGLDEGVSKMDLLEVAWDLASLSNDGDGCDDHEATRAKLLEMINARRVVQAIAKGSYPRIVKDRRKSAGGTP